PRARARRASSTERVRAERRAPEKKVKEVVRAVETPKPKVVTPDPVEGRKAPTPFALKKKILTKQRKRTIVVAFIMFLGIGASAAVGMTDGGRVDVTKTIEARNERIRNNTPEETDTLGSTVEVPVQDTTANKVPGSNLRGAGKIAPKPVPVPEVVSSTASSSDVTASSTETGVDEEAELESAEESVSNEEASLADSPPDTTE
ncbi:hypothetical protein KC730_00515, partial [Candidatus Kaiserbacteria bacterium]|nr:hypothetical protein [Candidatus Kaiserbacteria bacterium]